MGVMEIKDKTYIQFPKFRINASLELALEIMTETVNLPENYGRFKDGEGIIIDHIGNDGGDERLFCLVSGSTNGSQSLVTVKGPDGEYVTTDDYEELVARVELIEMNGGGSGGGSEDLRPV